MKDLILEPSRAEAVDLQVIEVDAVHLLRPVLDAPRGPGRQVLDDIGLVVLVVPESGGGTDRCLESKRERATLRRRLRLRLRLLAALLVGLQERLDILVQPVRVVPHPRERALLAGPVGELVVPDQHIDPGVRILRQAGIWNPHLVNEVGAQMDQRLPAHRVQWLIGAADLDADAIAVDGVDPVLLDDGRAIAIGAIDRAARPPRAAPLVIVPLEDLPGIGRAVHRRDAQAEVGQAGDGGVTEVAVGAPERANHAVQDDELRGSLAEVVPSATTYSLLAGENALLNGRPGNVAKGDSHDSLLKERVQRDRYEQRNDQYRQPGQDLPARWRVVLPSHDVAGDRDRRSDQDEDAPRIQRTVAAVFEVVLAQYRSGRQDRRAKQEDRQPDHSPVMQLDPQVEDQRQRDRGDPERPYRDFGKRHGRAFLSFLGDRPNIVWLMSS